MYYCFGCHASGTVFNFVMETAKISFPEAVRTLAMRANIPLSEAAPKSKEAQAKQKERQLLYRVNQWAAEYFHNQLRQRKLRKRGNIWPGAGFPSLWWKNETRLCSRRLDQFGSSG